MYDIFTYIWLIFMVNVGKYTIHGSVMGIARTLSMHNTSKSLSITHLLKFLPPAVGNVALL